MHQHKVLWHAPAVKVHGRYDVLSEGCGIASGRVADSTATRTAAVGRGKILTGSSCRAPGMQGAREPAPSPK